tara:strand:- start:298 stop:657 length:360 start_codon:yes stop_codon:yes gene_type:complete
LYTPGYKNDKNELYYFENDLNYLRSYNNKKMVDIQTKYTVEHNGENYFVYSGTCDNKRTKWITRTMFPVITGEKDGVKWEEDKFSITLQFIDGKMQYRNGVDNSIMMIYEGDEEEYGEW